MADARRPSSRQFRPTLCSFNPITAFFCNSLQNRRLVTVTRVSEDSFSTHVTSRLRLKCDGTRAENRFRLSEKRTSPFKSAGASVQSTTGNRGVRNSGSNAEYTMFRGSVKSTGYPLHSPVSPSLPFPYVTAFHHISIALYNKHNRTGTHGYTHGIRSCYASHRTLDEGLLLDLR
jgi:hypothetical protein